MKLRSLLTILTLSAILVNPAPAASPSIVSPGRIRFAGDPHLVSFLPINAGDFMFSDKVQPDISEVIPELGCDGMVIELDAPSYNLHPLSSDAGKRSRYWQILSSALQSASMTGLVYDVRIGHDLLTLLQSTTAADEFTSEITFAIQNAHEPLVTFATDALIPAVRTLRDSIRTSSPQILVGLKPPELPSSSDAAPWDFLILRPEWAPQEHRAQSLLPWFRSRYPGKIIFLQLKEPSLYHGILWSVTGAAGIYYDNTTIPPALENNTPLAALRAFNSLKGAASHSHVRLMEEYRSRNITAAYGVNDELISLISRERARMTLQVPGTPHRPEYIGQWYNPLTDQKIILPRVGASAAGSYHLSPPSDDPWMYTHRLLPASTDRDTTTPVVIFDPEFDLPASTPSAVTE